MMSDITAEEMPTVVPYAALWYEGEHRNDWCVCTLRAAIILSAAALPCQPSKRMAVRQKVGRT
eukprot:SAG11_NODE_3335_length_2519_cov_1.665289_2_plen_63_part_00